MAAPVYHTADMVRAMPDDGNTYQVVYGELLVTPAPRLWHQEVVARLTERLRAYVRTQGVGYVVGGRSDVSWGRTDVLVEPDIFAVPVEEARTGTWSRLHTLLLTVEVLSPSSLRHDRFAKRKLYQDMRVPLYWIVDAEAHEVEIWTPADAFPRVERARLVWQPSEARQPFILELAELFRPI